MDWNDNAQLREYIKALKKLIAAMQKCMDASDHLIAVQNNQIKYLEDWLNNNAPDFDFTELEKFRQN